LPEIVFDGDSVSTHFGFKPEDGWPYLVAGSSGVNLSTYKSTAAICLARLPQAVELHPRWYVLQIGQWSHNHEPLDEFSRNVGAILTEIRARSIRACVVSPPLSPRPWHLGPFVDALCTSASIHGALYIGLLDHMLALPDTEAAQWIRPDESRCHFSRYGHLRMAQMFSKSMESQSAP